MAQARVSTVRGVPRVVILGGGFGGAYCALALERILDRVEPPATDRLMAGQGVHYGGDVPFEIYLVNSENYLVYQPMLAEVVSGNVGIDDTVGPLRRLLRRTQVYVRDIEEVDIDAGTVTLAPGIRPRPHVLSFDHLVVAVGNVTDFRGMPGLPEHALRFKTLADAVNLRNHVIHVLEQAAIEPDPELRRELLSFVVAGGGFSGTEVVAELNDFVRRWIRDQQTLADDEPRLVLVHSGERVLDRELTPGLSKYATELLARRGVELRLGARLQSATPATAVLEDGSRIPTRTLVSTVPSSPNPLIEGMALATEGGRLVCDANLQAVDRANVWAVGDCARVPGPTGAGSPPTAQHAVRQAKLLAENISRALRAEAPKPYTFTGLGKLGSLGHHRAVAELPGGVHLSGRPAWLLWRSIYWWKLPGVDRKIRVGLRWLGDAVVGGNPVNLNLGSVQGVEQEHFEPGEYVFREGDRGNGLYMVVSGTAEVVSGTGAEQVLLATLGPGEFFGEMALLGGEVRNASVRCGEPLDLLFIPRSDFAALLDRLPKMRESIEQVAESRRERAASETSGDDSVGSASDR
jgi:NADH dehydrogenase